MTLYIRDYIIMFLVIVIAFMYGAYVVLLSQLATDGDTYNQIEIKIRELKIDNVVLREKLYSQESLQNVSKKAEQMGFVKQDGVAY